MPLFERIWRRIAESTWALKSTEGGATPKVAKATEADFIIEWIADELVSTYNYPIDWLGTRIVRADWHDKPRGQNLMGLKGPNDGISDPFIVVIARSGSTLETDLDFMRSQMEKDGYIQLGILSDGSVKGTNFLRFNTTSAEFEFIPDMESYISPERIGHHDHLGSRAERTRTVRPDFVNSSRSRQTWKTCSLKHIPIFET